MAVVFSPNGGIRIKTRIGSVTPKGPAAANLTSRCSRIGTPSACEYMFNREWGMMVRIPYANRDFTTDTGAPPDGMGIQTYNSRSVGDVEVMGMYTGFSKDMSTGVIFGLKLPSGTYTAYGLDRDTQIGSGSTDLILGAYHRGLITGDNAWQYFGQMRWQQPFLYSASYNPDSGVYGTLQARLSNRWRRRHHL